MPPPAPGRGCRTIFLEQVAKLIPLRGFDGVSVHSRSMERFVHALGVDDLKGELVSGL
jgi:hypothetical protein